MINYFFFTGELVFDINIMFWNEQNRKNNKLFLP